VLVCSDQDDFRFICREEIVDPRKFRREWSEKHKQLRSLLESGEELESARELFNDLHGVLHSGSIAGCGAWTYADQIFKGLDESQFRRITPGVDHSLVWILWHISRVEDITMNILVAQGQQVYEKEDWADRIASPLHHTGNEIGSADLHQLSQLTNISQLFAYREAVGRQTRQIMGNISVERLKEKVSPSDIQRLIA
jgi:hypothetical protein